jgi:hypothetical protein
MTWLSGRVYVRKSKSWKVQLQSVGKEVRGVTALGLDLEDLQRYLLISTQPCDTFDAPIASIKKALSQNGSSFTPLMQLLQNDPPPRGSLFLWCSFAKSGDMADTGHT